MRKSHFDVKWLLIWGLIIFLLVFQVLPLTYLIIRSFFPNGSFSFEGFQRIYSYALNWQALKNTLLSSTLSMIFGVLIAFPLAWLVGRTNMYGRKFFRSLFLITYMVPPYVGAMAWLRLLNPNVGTINVLLMKIFNLSESPFNIYSLGTYNLLLSICFYNHIKGHGKNGSILGRSK